MISDDIVLLLHIILFYGIAISPLIDNCHYKRLVLVLILFFTFQHITRYGKCGFINMERFFLKEKFKEGFLFRLIKPVICYKRNIIYKQYFGLVIIYIMILYIQLQKTKCGLFTI